MKGYAYSRGTCTRWSKKQQTRVGFSEGLVQSTGCSVNSARAGCIAYVAVLIANWQDPSHIILYALTVTFLRVFYSYDNYV